jgi:ribonuclease HI
MTELVAYTDGGCKPSRGHGGWGVHFELGDKTHDYWGSFPYITTNNASEVVAATEAMRMAKDLEIKDLTIKTDSQYTIKGALEYLPKWKGNDWKLGDGSEIKNKKEWVALDKAASELAEVGCSYTLEYVPGHSGDKGNDAADRNASKGVSLSMRGIADRREESVETSKWGKFKSADYNKLFAFSKLYYPSSVNTDMKTKDGLHVYYLGSHAVIGVPDIQAQHGVLFTKESDPCVDIILKFQNTIDTNGVDMPMFVNLDLATRPRVYKEALTDLGETLVKTPKGYGVRNVDKLELTEVLPKPRKALELIELFTNLERMLEDFRSGRFDDSECHSMTDITDSFYGLTAGKKPKPCLLKEIDNTTKKVSVTCKHKCGTEEEEMAMSLILGIDTPSRNKLSGMAGLEPKLTLLTETAGEEFFRHYLIIETEESIGLYTSAHANLRMASKGK